jgi:hypothetical protein
MPSATSALRPVLERPPSPRRRAPRALAAALAALGLALAGLAALPGCRHAYGIEERESPVHVWIDVPAARTADQTVELTVTVGGLAAARGTYLFPAGRPRQEMPPLYLRAGSHPVVVTRGGRVVASDTVPVGHVTWIVVTVDGAGASVARSRAEPGTAR